MELKRKGTRPSRQGEPDHFTGDVVLEQLVRGTDPARVTAVLANFQPGARTAWHSHPLGQTLIVVSGTGWTQCRGEPKVEIREGDVIWCPPGHEHWHGATATTAMSHIAIQERAEDGRVIDWLEPVSDEQYLA